MKMNNMKLELEMMLSSIDDHVDVSSAILTSRIAMLLPTLLNVNGKSEITTNVHYQWLMRSPSSDRPP
jgi:hypothetical protein